VAKKKLNDDEGGSIMIPTSISMNEGMSRQLKRMARSGGHEKVSPLIRWMLEQAMERYGDVHPNGEVTFAEFFRKAMKAYPPLEGEEKAQMLDELRRVVEEVIAERIPQPKKKR